jgi:hypothetical protein
MSKPEYPATLAEIDLRNLVCRRQWRYHFPYSLARCQLDKRFAICGHRVFLSPFIITLLLLNLEFQEAALSYRQTP